MRAQLASALDRLDRGGGMQGEGRSAEWRHVKSAVQHIAVVYRADARVCLAQVDYDAGGASERERGERGLAREE